MFVSRRTDVNINEVDMKRISLPIVLFNFLLFCNTNITRIPRIFISDIFCILCFASSCKRSIREDDPEYRCKCIDVRKYDRIFQGTNFSSDA